MIGEDFKIDLIKKRIYYNPKGSEIIYTIEELYLFLQDYFDELDTIDDDIPIQAKPSTVRYSAKSKTEFFLINGWVIDEEARKHLKEGLLL